MPRHAAGVTPAFRIDAVAVAALLAVMLALLGPALLPAHGLAGGDWTDLLYPFRRFAVESFRDGGRLPLWNPSIWGGMPHLASLNALALYPTEIASLPFGVEASGFYAADLIVHLLIAAAGMGWWLRRRGLDSAAASVGALAYALGAHLLTLPAAGHAHWVRGMAWLPWIFAGVEAGSVAGAAVAGALLGIVTLGAALHFVVLGGPIAAIWLLRLPGGRPARLAAFTLAAGLVGAVVWLPGLEYYALSIRRSADRAFAAGWSLSPWDLPALLLPGCWGGPTDWFGPHPFRSSADYPGLVVAALAAAGIAARPRTALPWVVLLGAAALLAFGPATPVGGLFASLPVFGGLRAPLRWLSFAHLPLAVLAASGWAALRDPAQSDPAGRGRRVAGGMATALGGWAVVVVIAALAHRSVGDRVVRLAFVAEHLGEGRVTEPAVRSAVTSSLQAGAIRAGVAAGTLAIFRAAPSPASAAALVIALAADLGFAARPWFQYGDDRELRRPDAVAAWLRDGTQRAGGPASRIATDEYFGLPNRRMGLGLEFTTGYHGLPLERTLQVHALATRTGSLAVLAALNAGWIVSGVPPAAGWTVEARLEDADGAPVWILRHPAALPRAWAAAPRPVADLDGALAVMGASGWTPAVVPLEGRPPAGWAPRSGDGTSPRGRISLAWAPDGMAATVELDRDALVVFSEAWYPAWRARVDGARAPILIACGALRGIALARGTHEIEMRYGGPAITIGMWLTCLGIVALATLGFSRVRA